MYHAGVLERNYRDKVGVYLLRVLKAKLTSLWRKSKEATLRI